MARRAVFDPTDRTAFVRDRQRFDHLQLQSGFVHRVPDGRALRRAGRLLRDLGYLVHELDASSWTGEDDLHTAFATALGFPSAYGHNLDALNDALSDVAGFEFGADPTTTGTAVLVDAYDSVARCAPRAARIAADVFARQAQYAALLGHPMMLLLRCDADLGPVGGRRVSLTVG